MRLVTKSHLPDEFLRAFPFIPIDPTLAQDSGQKFNADISLVRVWNSDRDVAVNHELMSSAGVRPLKSQSV